MNGVRFIALLTDHYRKFKGAESREVVFVISGNSTQYRPTKITPAGKVTRVLLVERKA
jgi:hypothetical protein